MGNRYVTQRRGSTYIMKTFRDMLAEAVEKGPDWNKAYKSEEQKVDLWVKTAINKFPGLKAGKKERFQQTFFDGAKGVRWEILRDHKYFFLVVIAHNEEKNQIEVMIGFDGRAGAGKNFSPDKAVRQLAKMPAPTSMATFIKRVEFAVKAVEDVEKKLKKESTEEELMKNMGKNSHYFTLEWGMGLKVSGKEWENKFEKVRKKVRSNTMPSRVEYNFDKGKIVLVYAKQHQPRRDAVKKFADKWSRTLSLDLDIRPPQFRITGVQSKTS